LYFAEALGILKLKHFNQRRPDHINQETYFTGADELLAKAARAEELRVWDCIRGKAL
jgi:hypothetical protein